MVKEFLCWEQAFIVLVKIAHFLRSVQMWEKKIQANTTKSAQIIAKRGFCCQMNHGTQ